jgi:DNA polymerase bacteriophage-type
VEVILDFETINCGGVDLTVVGSTVYAQHPLTEVVSLTFSAMGQIEIWTPQQPNGYLNGLVQADAIFIAHSAGFEKDIWRYIMVRVYGFPDIPNERWRDTQAVCAWKAIPIALEPACDLLELENRKDPLGHKLMRSLNKPNKQGEFEDARNPQVLRSVYTYNTRDILCQSELHSRIGVLRPKELSIWQLDQTINERGIRIDTDYCRAAMEVVRKASVPLLREFEELTGLRPGQRDKILGWAEQNGQPLPDLTKETVEHWIGGEDAPAWEPSRLPPRIARALRLRQLVNHSSTKKLQRMIDCTAEDGRAHRLIHYHGAGTGRWTGRLFQPQNFPRGTVRVDGKPPDPEVLVAAIMTGDDKYVEDVIGAPAIECVASGLRHALVSRRGHVFNSGDFVGIECRLDLALAGQQDRCAQLAAGQDVYCDMANEIYGREITKADIEQRQTGKNTVLGCGFQMGKNKFCQRYVPECSCRGMGVCQNPDGDTNRFAGTVIRTYRQEWAPLVPKLWRGLENAALTCVQTKRETEAYGVCFRIANQWLAADLPSGNTLWYYQPKLIQKKMPWTDDDGDPVIRPAWQFCSWSGERGNLQITDAYGGFITENVCQAMARELMVDAMFRCEKENFPIVLTVHDEILTEPKHGDLKTLEQIMTCRPSWAERIQVPIQIEAWEGDRYRK